MRNFSITASRIGSLTVNISVRAVRPAKPVSLQVSQPPPRRQVASVSSVLETRLSNAGSGG